MQGLIDTGGSGDDYAGIYGIPITYIGISGVGKYRVKTNSWLPYVSKFNYNDEENGMAGDGGLITALEIPNSKIKYQAHTQANGWLD